MLNSEAISVSFPNDRFSRAVRKQRLGLVVSQCSESLAAVLLNMYKFTGKFLRLIPSQFAKVKAPGRKSIRSLCELSTDEEQHMQKRLKDKGYFIYGKFVVIII